MQLEETETETVTVRFVPTGREITVVRGANLMDAAVAAGMALSQACDGETLCGFCRVIVEDGLDNLSPMAAEEQKLLRSFHAGPDERLACCATVHGPVAVTTDYWD
jgi:ferredoxin